MDIKVYFTIVVILSGVQGKTEIEIKEGNRVTQGQTIHIICSIDFTDGKSVVWTKKTGSIRVDLSDAHNRMKPDVKTSDRYSIVDYGTLTGKWSTLLTIQDVTYEDTAEIGCAPSHMTDERTYTTLAVCEDVTSTACECIEKNGWMLPTCFEKPVSVSKLEDKYDRTVTGLAVCLGIAVIFGLIMAIIVGWDCMAKAAAKKRKQLEMQQAKIAAKRAGYTGYEESERIDLDPNELPSSMDQDGLSSGTKSPAAINAYSSMMPNSERRNTPNTHINRAYLMDSNDKYAAPPYRHNLSAGNVPEPSNEVEVHAVDEDLRTRMEFDRSTPEGSVGSAKNNEPTANASRYNVRSPRYDDYNSNKYPGHNDHTNSYEPHRLDANNMREPHSSYNNYNAPVAHSPGAWSTQSAGLPPGSKDEYPSAYESRNAYSEKPSKGFQGRSGYTEPRNLDFTYGKSDTNKYKNSYEPTGAYIDKSDTVV